MVKTILYYLIAVTTAVRLADMVYLLSRGDTNLPLSVLIVTSAMILFGLVLVAQKFLGNIRVRQHMFFFGAQVTMVVANLITVAIHVPMQVSLAETLAVGSFLDIIVAACALYAGMKHMLNEYHPFVRVVGKEQA